MPDRLIITFTNTYVKKMILASGKHCVNGIAVTIWNVQTKLARTVPILCYVNLVTFTLVFVQP